MTWLINLAAVARETGYPVVEVAGWQTRGAGPMGDVRSIVCHHTAGASTGDMPSLPVLVDGRTDLSGPLAHFGVGRSGRIYVIAEGVAHHAGVVTAETWSNSHAIGIEAEHVGDASVPWPSEQLDAYVRLCRALLSTFGLQVDRVRGHKEICSPTGRKVDPAGIDMTEFRRRIADTPTTPSTQEWDEMATPEQIREIVREEVEGLLAYPHPGNKHMVEILRAEGVSGANGTAGKVIEYVQNMLAYPQPANRHLVGVLRSEGISGATGAIAALAAQLSGLSAAIETLAASGVGGTVDMAAVQAAAEAGAEEGARAVLAAAQVTVDVNVGEAAQ